MPFLQLNLTASAQAAAELEASCFAAGALSVTLSDAADAPIFEPDLNTTPLWPETKISALFPGEADPAQVLAALGLAPERHSLVRVPDRAWEREWLADFKPMPFGKRLWICPREQTVAMPDAVVVKLDPGLAFGTGTHPTTAMCLQWLDGAELERKEIIDYGCGSGILAIAALKLGAARAWAVDHDPQALLATRENAFDNGVADRLETLSPATQPPVADILLANILAGPLIELSQQLGSMLRQGGHIVLSGILQEQADSVLAAYSPSFDMLPVVQQGDWIRLHGVRH